MAPPPPPPPVSHVLETCLYVKDINSATDFYTNKLRLRPLFNTERMAVYPLGHTTLILFALGHTNNDQSSERGLIPGHGPSPRLLAEVSQSEGKQLRQHFCLAVDRTEDVKVWEEWFADQDVGVIGVMNWEKGGRSVYFKDLDGHIGEIGSRGIWEHY